MPQHNDPGEGHTRSEPRVGRAKTPDEAQAAEEASKPTVSEPGGFANDPDDPTNPNEVIERHRRHLRP